MRVIVICLFFAATVYSYPTFDETIDEFNKEFGVIITSDLEKKKDAERLKVVEAEINAQNEKYEKGEASFGGKLYEFSDWSKDEFEKVKLGNNGWNPSNRPTGMIMPPESERNSPENQANLDRMYSQLDNRGLPKTYSSHALGYVTSPRNQGNCGSCVAFAASGLHEVCMAKAGAPKRGLDLSEQFLVDCGYDGKQMNGCKGAAPHRYTAFFWEKGGQGPHEATYPYLDNYPKLNCKTASKVPTWNSGAKVSEASWDYNCNEDKLMSLVYQYGAAVAGVYASDDAFVDYDGRGVFNQCSRNKQSNHAVLVVGWGEERGEKYWLIKNSWGFGWGAFGYLKLRRGTNECNIGDVCVVANCQSTGKPDFAPATTPRPKIPVNLWCDITSLTGGKSNLNGYFNMRSDDRSHPGEVIEAYIRCKNSKCTPALPGPTNACMYICGATNCDR